MTLEKLAKLSEKIEETDQQKTYFLQAIKHITSEVNLTKEKAYKIEIKKYDYINNEVSMNIVQEYLDKFQKLAKELSFKMCIIEAKRERLELDFKQIEAQYSEQKTPKALVSPAPHSASLSFRFTADVHHQKNTSLASEEILQNSNSNLIV